MKRNFTATVEISIYAPAATVWNALTDPDMIRQYLFGTIVETDWKTGSPIIWKGVWKGVPYEDKGKIVRIVPERLLVTTYWSSMTGAPDVSENYCTVTYELDRIEKGTRLKLTQDNNATETDKNHSEQNWKLVLENLKKLSEEQHT